MFIYNVHSPSKTFALPYKEDEGQGELLSRILGKLSLQKDEAEAVTGGKDGAGVIYEFEGERWSLDDDEDLSILHSRLPPDSTASATIHLNLPHPHAHFAPPAYNSASSAIKSKSTKSTKEKPKLGKIKSAKPLPNGTTSGSKVSPSPLSPSLAAGVNGAELGPVKAIPKIPEDAQAGAGTSAPVGQMVNVPPPAGEKVRAMSMMSGKSRRSKWGDDDAEPMGDVLKREWLDFQSHQSVRTVMGRVGKIANVRMLLKPGYLYVYVSRNFATKHQLVPKQYAMGAAGYAGLKILGDIPITVGSRTQTHRALISEEQHFDVVLGRKWLEKMGIKTDAIDPTNLKYMDTGEPISCELVVLKDSDGNPVIIT